MSAFWVLLRKDLVVEGRARDLLPSMTVLALLLLAVTGAAGLRTESAPVILWVTVTVAAASGLVRSFSQETEQDQLHGLRMAGVDPAVIYLAKAVGNFLIVTAVEVIAWVAVTIFFDIPIPQRPALLAVLLTVLLLGTTSLVAMGTLLGAMLAAGRMREALLPVLLLPLSAPAVMAASGATTRLLAGSGPVTGELRLLLAFTVLFVAVAVLLSEHIVED